MFLLTNSFRVRALRLAHLIPLALITQETFGDDYSVEGFNVQILID